MSAAKAATSAVSPRDIIYSARMSRQLMEEAGVRFTDDGLPDLANLLVNPKSISAEMVQLRNARSKLNKLYGSSNPIFDRPAALDVGGLKLVADSPEKFQEAAQALDEWRTAAVSINKKAGLGGHSTAAKFNDVTNKMEMQGAEATSKMLANDPHVRVKDAALGKQLPREGLDAGISAVDAAGKEMNAAWGLKAGSSLNDAAIQKFLKMDPDKMLAAAQSHSKYMQTLEGFVKQFDDGAAAAKFAGAKQQLDDALGMISKNPEVAASGTSGAELLASMGLISEMPEVDGPADEMIKLWLGARMLKGKVPKGTGTVAASVKDQVKRGLVDKATNLGAGLISQVPVVGPRVASMVKGLVGGGAKFAESTGGHVARIARATESLAKGVSKGSRAISPTATALLNAYSFGDKPPSGNAKLQSAYKERMKELAEIAANPDAAQLKIHNNLEPVRQVNMMLADKLEMQAMADAMYLHEKAPKDPGTSMMLGSSRWQPSEDEVMRWAGHFRALDPAGVWERVANGSVTPQEAEALRKLRPETFAEIQKQVVENLPQIQKNTSYDQRNRLTMLFDVPVDPLMNKHTVTWVQQQFADRAAAPGNQPVDMNSNAFKPEPPTAGDKFQSR